MQEMSGDFEIHLTAWDHDRDRLAAFAEEHGLGYVYIELDRGVSVFQPMLTLTRSGPLGEIRALAEGWARRMRDVSLHPVRVKIEAAPWNTGVPLTDADANQGRYFEHHVKLRLPTDALALLLQITDLVEPHGARLSRNARRRDADGAHQRFVNQRCHGAGVLTAKRRLDDLVAVLRAAGHEIVSVEQEYVVDDTNLELDRGWLDVSQPWVDEEREARMRTAPAGTRDYPPTYRPVPGSTAAFDPALKQWPNAYRSGEPAHPARRWRVARRAALDHVLTVVASSRWAGHLVLRGSVTMAAWAPDAARDPGDLDFVVTPATITSGSAEAVELLDGIVAAVTASPGAGLRPEATTQSAIWTYERADGRRLVIPFSDDGFVQIDVVFGETLPIPPAELTLPGVDVPVLAATPALSLAWKLLWLATDMYPQGKDLYDATLLAEHSTVDLALVRDLLRPELGAAADDFTAAEVLRWDVDWRNFTDEYPAVGGTAEEWLRRLATVLDQSWNPPGGA
jgi:hypothetical protein